MLILFCLLLALFFVPYGTFIGGIEEYRMTLFAMENVSNPAETLPTTYLGILAVCCTILPLITIFLFKRRWVQIRMCIVEMVLLLGLQIFFVFYLWRTQSSISVLENYSISYSVVSIVPLVGIILSYLAFRGIARDEALVRSLDRIR